MNPRCRIEQVTWSESRAELEQLRRQVFVEEQQVPEEEEWDDRDPNALHFLAFDHYNRPIGTVRLLQEGKITRMAVHRDWRGKGVGTALLQRVLQLAMQLRLHQVYLDAQMSAAGFYKKSGFKEIGDVFMDVGISHIRMIRKLSGGDMQPDKDTQSDDNVTRFDHPSDILPLMREFATRAHRTIDIFSHQLTAALYDDTELVDAISTLARRGVQTQVRVLVRDPRPLYGCDRPLLNLI